MKKIILLFLMGALGYSASLGMRLGTLGVGVEASIPLHKRLLLSLSAQGYKYTTQEYSFFNDIVIDDREYVLSNYGAVLEYHFESLYLAGGLYINKNHFTQNSYLKELTPAIISTFMGGTLRRIEADIRVDYPTISPYVGLGYKSSYTSKGLFWGVEAGLLYQGAPKLSFDINTKPKIIGTAMEKTGLTALVKEKLIKERVPDSEIYPVVMVQIGYRF